MSDQSTITPNPDDAVFAALCECQEQKRITNTEGVSLFNKSTSLFRLEWDGNPQSFNILAMAYFNWANEDVEVQLITDGERETLDSIIHVVRERFQTAVQANRECKALHQCMINSEAAEGESAQPVF